MTKQPKTYPKLDDLTVQFAHKTTLDQLHLSVRAKNCIGQLTFPGESDRQVQTAADLLCFESRELRQVKNCGELTIAEINTRLRERLGIVWQEQAKNPIWKSSRSGYISDIRKLSEFGHDEAE